MNEAINSIPPKQHFGRHYHDYVAPKFVNNK